MTSQHERYTAEEGARIVAEVRQHPKRDLIRALAQAMFDIANENGDGAGGGMWWHLSFAIVVVETLPELTLRAEMAAETPTEWLERVSRETGIEMANLRAERDEAYGHLSLANMEREEAVEQLAEARAELEEFRRTHAPRWAWPIQLVGWLLAVIGWASLIWGLIDA